jgi:hypothetical protein
MSEEKKFPTRILVVGSGGTVGLAMEVAKQIAEKNYEVQVVDPRHAKEIGLKPNNDIVPIKGWIPETHQYYPLTEVEPNRRTRRKQERQNKRKR